jgi:hypothetical protein
MAHGILDIMLMVFLVGYGSWYLGYYAHGISSWLWLMVFLVGYGSWYLGYYAHGISSWLWLMVSWIFCSWYF